jgi:hypothetical protein
VTSPAVDVAQRGQGIRGMCGAGGMAPMGMGWPLQRIEVVRS